MPNWVNNRLTITGDPEKLKTFNYQEGDLLFAPYLKPKTELDNAQTLEWQRKNFGCKWDCEINFLSETEDILTLEFSSPWTPPTKGVQALSKMFPGCEFELYSYGFEYETQTKVWLKKGRITREEERPFFGEETECVNCGVIISPELDWEGNIECYECPECGFDNSTKV